MSGLDTTILLLPPAHHLPHFPPETSPSLSSFTPATFDEVRNAMLSASSATCSLNSPLVTEVAKVIQVCQYFAVSTYIMLENMRKNNFSNI